MYYTDDSDHIIAMRRKTGLSFLYLTIIHVVLWFISIHEIPGVEMDARYLHGHLPPYTCVCFPP